MLLFRVYGLGFLDFRASALDLGFGVCSGRVAVIRFRSRALRAGALPALKMKYSQDV